MERDTNELNEFSCNNETFIILAVTSAKFLFSLQLKIISVGKTKMIEIFLKNKVSKILIS